MQQYSALSGLSMTDRLNLGDKTKNRTKEYKKRPDRQIFPCTRHTANVAENALEKACDSAGLQSALISQPLYQHQYSDIRITGMM